ncbi:DUF29 family protein [Azospirillum sp. INR13]|uniref:DUF29 family protein n=1 Tax=Azospirillum sp. INR13 TaxID=2596919 RepID=UPI00351C6FE6
MTKAASTTAISTPGRTNRRPFCGRQTRRDGHRAHRRGDREHGRRERRELLNRLRVLLRHLLVWTCLPSGQCGSWRSAITGDRKEIEYLLRDSPSLAGKLDDLVAEAYLRARLDAVIRTGMDEATFPRVARGVSPK